MKQKTSNRIRFGIIAVLCLVIFGFAVQRGYFLFSNSHLDEGLGRAAYVCKDIDGDIFYREDF